MEIANDAAKTSARAHAGRAEGRWRIVGTTIFDPDRFRAARRIPIREPSLAGERPSRVHVEHMHVLRRHRERQPPPLRDRAPLVTLQPRDERRPALLIAEPTVHVRLEPQPLDELEAQIDLRRLALEL